MHVVNKLCGPCWLIIAEDGAGVIIGLAVLAVILVVWYYIVICVIMHCVVSHYGMCML